MKPSQEVIDLSQFAPHVEPVVEFEVDSFDAEIMAVAMSKMEASLQARPETAFHPLLDRVTALHRHWSDMAARMEHREDRAALDRVLDPGMIDRAPEGIRPALQELRELRLTGSGARR